MYHPTILKLDAAAGELHEIGMPAERDGAFRIAGQIQQALLAKSPYERTTRFLNAQWVWAFGHIGLTYQLIRWFKYHEPDTRLILETQGCANPHFLNALAPFLTITAQVPNRDAAMQNAVYFGCPDGIHNLVSFYKLIQRQCKDINLLALNDLQQAKAEAILTGLRVKRPYVALHVRNMAHDPARNVSSDMVNDALEEWRSKGYSVVSTGLDLLPDGLAFPSVTTLPDAHLASFLLSADCDLFIGSNSGAWTVADAYRRDVIILNDYEHNAWIYT